MFRSKMCYMGLNPPPVVSLFLCATTTLFMQSLTVLAAGFQGGKRFHYKRVTQSKTPHLKKHEKTKITDARTRGTVENAEERPQPNLVKPYAKVVSLESLGGEFVNLDDDKDEIVLGHAMECVAQQLSERVKLRMHEELSRFLPYCDFFSTLELERKKKLEGHGYNHHPQLGHAGDKGEITRQKTSHLKENLRGGEEKNQLDDSSRDSASRRTSKGPQQSPGTAVQGMGSHEASSSSEMSSLLKLRKSSKTKMNLKAVMEEKFQKQRLQALEKCSLRTLVLMSMIYFTFHCEKALESSGDSNKDEKGKYERNLAKVGSSDSLLVNTEDEANTMHDESAAPQKQLKSLSARWNTYIKFICDILKTEEDIKIKQKVRRD